MSTISVVIPTYQRGPSVCRALRALSQQTLPPEDFEVVVSVDGSTDGTLAAVRALDLPFSLTALAHPNRGRAAACNAGAAAAIGDWIVFLDDDMEPVPGFLAAHRHRQRGTPGLGVLGAAPVVLRSTDSPAVRYTGAKFNRHLEALATPGRRLGLRDFYSGNFSVARETFLRVGGFDEDFRRYGNEDLELSIRLARAGVTFVYEPAAEATQHMEKGFSALAADQQAKGYTAVLLATKHPEAFAELKLGSFDDAPLPARLVRGALLALSRRRPSVPDWVGRAEAWVSRAAPHLSTTLYPLMMGYFYWLGARSALQEYAAAGTLPALTDLARKLHA